MLLLIVYLVHEVLVFLGWLVLFGNCLHPWRKSTFLVNYSFPRCLRLCLLLVLFCIKYAVTLFLALDVAAVDQPRYVPELNLVKSQILLFLFQYDLLALNLQFQLLPLLFHLPNLVVALFLNLLSLGLELLDAFLQLADGVFIDIIRIRTALLVLLFQLRFNLFDFFLLDNVVLMELTQLLFLLVDRLHVFPILLSQFCEVGFHSFVFLLGLLILASSDGLVLPSTNLLQRSLFILQDLQFLLEELELVLFLHNLVYIVLIVEVLSQLLDHRLILLDLGFLLL